MLPTSFGTRRINCSLWNKNEGSGGGREGEGKSLKAPTQHQAVSYALSIHFLNLFKNYSCKTCIVFKLLPLWASVSPFRK